MILNMSIVINNFSKLEWFRRGTKNINDIGREELKYNYFKKFCYIHPAEDKDLQDINKEGYHVEDAIKIFCKVNEDLENDDEVLYDNKIYRIIKTNNKKNVSGYKKLFAKMLHDADVKDFILGYSKIGDEL